MNTEVFTQAKQSYAAGDYAQALQLLTECLEDTTQPPVPGEVGLLYHQVGNCLVKLNNHNEAIQAYTQATADSAYGAVGSVNYNLGMAYAALGDFEDAINHFEIAVSDGRYDAPYKAYLAMGNSLMKLGKSAEAGIAFRAAALDERNPNPVRPLLNLGVCFMALNRPNDAVVSYESALQFDMDSALKNKLYANLGQAYVACGQYQKACHAFEQALADKTYYLSDSANVDYRRAVGAVAQGLGDTPEVALPEPVTSSEPTLDPYGSEVEKPEYQAGQDYNSYSRGAHSYGQQEEEPVAGYAYPGADEEYQPYEDYREDTSKKKKSKKAKKQQQTGEEFFESQGAADEQWEMLSNAAPKRRRLGLKIAVFFMVLLIAAMGVGIYFYTQGYGYPSQETVVSELFRDPEAAKTELFADGINEATATQLVAQIQQDKSVTIDGVNKTMSTSEVYATTTLTEGGKITYKISLIRDMISWKISNVEIYHPSTD